MEKIRIYCNYGVLSAEKRNVYTFSFPSPSATCYDEIIVEVPEGWSLGENYLGETLVESPWGECYLIDKILHGNKKPCFLVRDNKGNERRIPLKEI